MCTRRKPTQSNPNMPCLEKVRSTHSNAPSTISISHLQRAISTSKHACTQEKSTKRQLSKNDDFEKFQKHHGNSSRWKLATSASPDIHTGFEKGRTQGQQRTNSHINISPTSVRIRISMSVMKTGQNSKFQKSIQILRKRLKKNSFTRAQDFVFRFYNTKLAPTDAQKNIS